MTNYSIIAQRFNTEFRNGSTFATNPTTDFSVDLKANVGELCKLTQTIEISVTVNPDEIQTIQYNATSDATYGEFVGTGINFMTQGLYTGAVLDVTWGGGPAVSATVSIISGPGYNTLKVTKANLTTAGIVDGDIRTDFKFRLTSVPDTLIYKYGLNKNDFTGTNYTSWFDNNIQGYYISNLTTSLQTMTRIGLGIKSWDLSTVQAKFDSTSGTYFHQYTVEHTFRIPHYVEGEYENINDGTSPDRFLGTASIRYDNGWFFGGTTLGEYIKVEIKGGPGNVGYFKESFNGYANNYAIQNVAISNADNSGVLEGTVVNTLTFQIKKNSAGNFSSSSKVILYHSKLPTQTEYQNKTTDFSTLWIFESLVTTETAAPVSGTIITNFNITLNADPTILDVTADIQYTAAQQSLIFNGSNYLTWISVGYEGAMNPDDRVALPVDLDQFSKDLDVPGLITGATVTFFEPFEFYTGVRGITTWTGFDGDLGGTNFEVVRDTSIYSAITKVQFKIISTNGTDEMELLAIDVPIGKVQVVELGSEFYQILNTNTPGSFTLPTNTLLNRIVGETTVPSAPTGSQTYNFRLGFQTPWRDWIFNNTVPNDLYDVTIPQNNQNYKTSNYSNVDGYEVFAVWEATATTQAGVSTITRKLTAESNVTDFDTAGSAGFSGVVKVYTPSVVQTTDLSPYENRIIVVDFPHALGTITKANLEGYIWIERDGSSEPPWFLHSSLDFTKLGHPLLPTDTESTGNTQFVEVRSINNLVQLICQTDHNQIQDGVTYNIYGRLKNKTIV